MDRADKYKDLKQNLFNISLQPFQGSYHVASLYFFKMLQNIHVDTIIAKADIDELQEKIRFIQARLKQAQAREVNRKKNITPETEQKRIRNHQNGIGKEGKFVCQIMDCGQRFLKQSELKFHQIFQHQEQKAKRNQIFNIQIKNESEI